MKKYITLIILLSSVNCFASALLVENAKITRVSTPTDDDAPFNAVQVFVSGGSGPCANQWLYFRKEQTTAPTTEPVNRQLLLNQQLSMALTAMMSGYNVTIRAKGGLAQCDHATSILIRTD